MDDPEEYLKSVEAAKEAQPITEEEIIHPEGVPLRRLDISCGVIHPCVFAWIAELLGISIDEVESRASDKHNDTPVSDGTGSSRQTGVSAIAQELESCADSPLKQQLEEMGFSPSDLVTRCLPVSAGSERPNPPSPNGNPIRSAQNAAWLQLYERVRMYDIIQPISPAVIAAVEATFIQRSFLYVLDWMTGRPLRFHPREELPTSPPTPPEFVLDPPRYNMAAQSSRVLFHAVFVVNGVLLQYANALVHIDLPETAADESPKFSVTRLGDSGLAAVGATGQRVLFLKGINTRASVYDVSSRQFVRTLDELPMRVVTGACCSIDLLDLNERTTCSLPGPPLDSPIDFATSPCGRYVWLCLAPPSDLIGILSLESGETVYQPWPHPVLDGIAFDDEELNDFSLRALCRLPNGTFRLLWNRFLLTGPSSYIDLEEKRKSYTAACFTQDGSQLLLAKEESFCILSLDEPGNITNEQNWNLAPALNHITWHAIQSPNLAARFSEEEIMRAVGTVTDLANSTPREVMKDFEHTFRFADPGKKVNEQEAAELIALAKAAMLPNQLHAS